MSAKVGHNVYVPDRTVESSNNGPHVFLSDTILQARHHAQSEWQSISVNFTARNLSSFQLLCTAWINSTWILKIDIATFRWEVANLFNI